jgi:hypothetical protein
MSTFKGFVARINEKGGTNARGPWTVYSVKIEKDDGTEYDEWVSLGFEKPPIAEGDYVSFDTTVKDGRHSLTKGTMKKPKNPPSRTQKQKSGGGAKGGGSSRGNYGGGGAKFDGTGIQNRTNPIDARRMGLSHARSSAIDVVTLLLSSNALPLTKATTKAGESARFDEIVAAVDKLTVKFFNDIEQDRLVSTVADTGEIKKPEAEPLPDAGEQADIEDPDQAGPAGNDEDDDAPIF